MLYKRDGPHLFVMNSLSEIEDTSITNFIPRHGKLLVINYLLCKINMFGRSERYAGLETNILTYLCKLDSFFQEDN